MPRGQTQPVRKSRYFPAPDRPIKTLGRQRPRRRCQHNRVRKRDQARAPDTSLDSITIDELALVMSDGTRETWTRAPAE
jgi:hypothetical protein